MLGQIRPLAHQLGDLSLLFSRQLRLRSGRNSIAKTLQPFGVVAVNPIAQNLPIHPAGSGSLPARFALQNQRQGQHATGNIGVTSPFASPRSSDAV